MAVSIEEFKEAIKTPMGFVAFVLDHNLPAVNQNIVKKGLSSNVLTRDSAYAVLQRLAEQGKNQDLIDILSVPLNPNQTNGTENYVGAVVEVARMLKVKPVSSL